MKVGILTVSDRGAAGEYEDRSGPLIAQILQERVSAQISRQEIVPDERTVIAEVLRDWCQAGIQFVVTSGGTGFAPRDVTPEATRDVIEREAPGIAEALRAESRKVTQHAMLSRGIAGIRGRTLIVNLPGNPKAVRENLDVLVPVLPHALDLLREASDSEAGHRTV